MKPTRSFDQSVGQCKAAAEPHVCPPKATLRLIADRNRTLIASVRDNRELAKLPNSRALFLVFVLRLCATLFDHITHIAQYKDRKGSHALLLFGGEKSGKVVATHRQAS